MNIFVLSEDPIIAASYHCNQHLNKMILESAQLLSTATYAQLPEYTESLGSYAPAYKNHPCTIWASASLSNMRWILDLALSLDYHRKKLYLSDHASMRVIHSLNRFFLDCLFEISWQDHTPFVCAMPPHISIRQDLDPVQKYQKYYQLKSIQWGLTTRGRMSYARRSVPDFMKDYI